MTRRITVELDAATIDGLAVLGPPIDVLVRLARSAVDIVRGPTHDERTRTDMSLQLERKMSDDAIVGAAEAAAAAVRAARIRADQAVQTARAEADAALPRRATPAYLVSDRVRADARLEDERHAADVVVERDRVRDPRPVRLVEERAATDKDLRGERSQLDALIADQREVNQQMVEATLRAHDLREVAEAATLRAVASEHALAEAAEFREMFLGIVSHDLRTPLGAISMGAELMLDGGRLSKHDVTTVTRMLRSTQRMHAMITQLLDLTRARLGAGIPIMRAPVDLGQLCQEVVEEFRIPIELKLEGDLTGLWDRDRLAEVIANLTGNAVRHAAPDTFVLVTARADAAGVVVEVSNRGESIPAAFLPSIFEPFRGASRQSSVPHSGLGLGLYIAMQIVRMHGGTLDVLSADGTTVFTVHLPRTEPETA